VYLHLPSACCACFCLQSALRAAVSLSWFFYALHLPSVLLHVFAFPIHIHGSPTATMGRQQAIAVNNTISLQHPNAVSPRTVAFRQPQTQTFASSRSCTQIASPTRASGQTIKPRPNHAFVAYHAAATRPYSSALDTRFACQASPRFTTPHLVADTQTVCSRFPIAHRAYAANSPQQLLLQQALATSRSLLGRLSRALISTTHCQECLRSAELPPNNTPPSQTY